MSRTGARTFLPPFAAGAINTFGPWYKGKYDALIVGFNKRLSHRFILNGDYAYARETDNQLGINSLPSDSFVGIAPVVSSTENGVLMTNANGPYVRANGRLVPQANMFVNGPDRDKGPSDLSLEHLSAQRIARPSVASTTERYLSGAKRISLQPNQIDTSIRMEMEL